MVWGTMSPARADQDPGFGQCLPSRWTTGPRTLKLLVGGAGAKCGLEANEERDCALVLMESQHLRARQITQSHKFRVWKTKCWNPCLRTTWELTKESP